jgi:ribosome modulation factor
MKITRTSNSEPETLDKAFSRGELAGRGNAPKSSCPYIDLAWRRAWGDGHYFGKWQQEIESSRD